MLHLQTTTQYRKDRKRAIKRGLPMNLLDDVLQMLIEEKPLDPKHNDHTRIKITSRIKGAALLQPGYLLFTLLRHLSELRHGLRHLG